MAVYVSNITIPIGSDFKQTFTLNNTNNTPLNLTGYSGISLMKKHPSSLTVSAIFDVSFPDRLNGRVKISLASSVTSTLKPGRYSYDILLDDGISKNRVIEGSAIVTPGVTTPVTVTSPSSITIGTQGTQGLGGSQGIQGSQGLQGTDGAFAGQGIQGVQGSQGQQGPIGSQGIQGIQGSPGSLGVQGLQGIQGSQGIQGLQGSQGLNGAFAGQGIQGIQGSQGPIGPQGIQGIQGFTASQGIQGLQGRQGIQGTDGAFAAQGIQGIQGVQGNTGTPGIFSRVAISTSTGIISAGSTANVIFEGYKSYLLFKVDTSAASWITLYVDENSRQSDSSRLQTTDPLPGSGVIAEVISTGSTSQLITPAIVGFNNDPTPSTSIYAKIVNNSGVSTNINASLTILKLEI